jgi:hypothetical protein
MYTLNNTKREMLAGHNPVTSPSVSCENEEHWEVGRAYIYLPNLMPSLLQFVTLLVPLSHQEPESLHFSFLLLSSNYAFRTGIKKHSHTKEI